MKQHLLHKLAFWAFSMAGSPMVASEAPSWYALPVAVPGCQTTIGAVHRFVNKLSPFAWPTWFAPRDEHMPRYEEGAPSDIFVLDCVDGKVTVTRVSFVMTGGRFFKTGARQISTYFEDVALMTLIRQTTGIEEPWGQVSWQMDFYPGRCPGKYTMLDFAVHMVRGGGTVEWRSRINDLTIVSPYRPFVFVSSRVTDSMLLEALGGFTLLDLADHIANDQELGRLVPAFQRWCRSVHKALRELPERGTTCYLAIV